MIRWGDDPYYMTPEEEREAEVRALHDKIEQQEAELDNLRADRILFSNAELGELIYRAQYEHRGGRWELVETRDVWIEYGERLQDLMLAAAPKVIAPVQPSEDAVERAAKALAPIIGFRWQHCLPHARAALAAGGGADRLVPDDDEDDPGIDTRGFAESDGWRPRRRSADRTAVLEEAAQVADMWDHRGDIGKAIRALADHGGAARSSQEAQRAMSAPVKLSEAEFAELKRKRDDAVSAMIDAVCAKHGWPRGEVSVHVSHSTDCYCACPDGPCQHEWNGPDWEDESTVSVTCSRCGTPAIFHDMRCGP